MHVINYELKNIRLISKFDGVQYLLLSGQSVEIPEEIYESAVDQGLNLEPDYQKYIEETERNNGFYNK